MKNKLICKKTFCIFLSVFISLSVIYSDDNSNNSKDEENLFQNQQNISQDPDDNRGLEIKMDDYEDDTIDNESEKSSDNYTQLESDYESTPDSYTEAEEKNPDDKKKKKKNKKNPFAAIVEQKQEKYIFYDSVPLATGTLLYGIKHRDASVFVDPKTENVGIQVFYQSSWFDFIFTRKELALIEQGLEKYISDFDEHKLIKKKAFKTRKMYADKGKCRVEWGTVRIMMNYFGDTHFHVGYEFMKEKNKTSPYFCIIVKDAKNLATDLGSNIPEKSVEVQLYFTKSEAKNLLNAFSRERVMQEIQKNKFESDEY